MLLLLLLSLEREVVDREKHLSLSLSLLSSLWVCRGPDASQLTSVLV